MSYALHYHRGIPGRGEFVRLLFVHAGTPFHDLPPLSAQDAAQHFAPPLLRYTSAADAPPDFAAEVELSQTPVILYFLASRLGLAPSDEAGRLAVQQRVETILDLANEVHDVHHPVDVSLYYEDQRDVSLRRAPYLLQLRIPKFLSTFAAQVSASGNGWLHSSGVSAADLVLFHLLEGLAYAFPRYFGTLKKEARFAPLFELQSRLRETESIQRYLKSEARTPFNEYDLFRHYPELDAEYTGKV